jgi:hypothetical protein
MVMMQIHQEIISNILQETLLINFLEHVVKVKYLGFQKDHSRLQ